MHRMLGVGQMRGQGWREGRWRGDEGERCGGGGDGGEARLEDGATWPPGLRDSISPRRIADEEIHYVLLRLVNDVAAPWHRSGERGAVTSA